MTVNYEQAESNLGEVIQPQTVKACRALFLEILLERVKTNAFARDVFADWVPTPRSLVSAEHFYRVLVWNTYHRACVKDWVFPEPEQIVEDAPPYFKVCERGKSVAVELAGGAAEVEDNR